MQDTDAGPIRVDTAADLDALVGRRPTARGASLPALEEYDRALVEFYTDGCGACAAMEPILNIVARETGVPVILVNPRDDPVLIEEYDIRSVPTLVLFERGAEVKRVADGVVGAERLVEFVER